MRKFIGLMMAASALAALAIAAPAMAQQTYPTAAGGVRVQGVVPLQCNASGAACGPITATNPAGPTQVSGDVASGATDSGNPVKVGGTVATSPPSYTNGTRGNLSLTTSAGLRVTVGGSGADVLVFNTGSDGISTSQASFWTFAQVGVYNGTSWDRQRGDTFGTYNVPAPSAAATNGLAANASAAVASAVVGKASAGNLYGFNVVAGASAGFVLVFNATSAPADGAVTPVKCYPVAASGAIEQNYRSLPVAFTTGITVVFSTTGCFSKTASATAFISVDAK